MQGGALDGALTGLDVRYLSDCLKSHEKAELFEYLREPQSFARAAVGRSAVVSFRPEGSLVFKLYRISGLRNSWRARKGLQHPKHGFRFGDAELQNYRNAVSLDLRVPELKAVIGLEYGIRHAQQVVVLERLKGFENLAACVGDADALDYVLAQVASIVLELASKGVLHFDLNNHNLMLSPCRQHIRLIDLERMSWNCRSRSRLAGYYFGYLLQKRLQSRMDPACYRGYVDEVLRRAFSDSDEYREASVWFERASTSRLSRTEIRGLFA